MKPYWGLASSNTLAMPELCTRLERHGVRDRESLLGDGRWGAARGLANAVELPVRVLPLGPRLSQRSSSACPTS